MKEAIASTLIIKILIVFIVIYIAFLAVSVNYSQAFKVKNEVINIIEQFEGNTGSAAEEIEVLRDKLKYTNEISVETICTSRGPYYKVTTHIEIDFPLVDRLNFPISGETKIIYKDQETCQ